MRPPHSANLVVTLSLSALLTLLGCSKSPQQPGKTPSQSSVTESSAPPQEIASHDPALPQVGVAEYIGSQACVDCHKDEHSSWHRTYHRTMTQVASPKTVVADFNNVVLTNGNTRFTLLTKGDELWTRMEPVSGEGVGSGLETRMGLVTGSHHMQVFWLPEGHGNLQIGFPFTWLIPEKRWVPRNATFIRPPDFEHRSEAWNIICSRCHTTGVEPRFDSASRTVDTHVGELGISCEACHGPGRSHVELRTVARGTPDAPLQPNEIIHPEKLSAERSSQTCGFCHSMKWIDHSEDWRHHGFRFRPGDDLEKTTPIIRASSPNEIPGLAAYLTKNPDILRDFFWSDGMIRVSGREFNGLIESPCYKGGKFSCLSCHSGHESEPDDLLALRGRSNAACLQCHDKFKATAELTAHTRHSANSSGSECYNCHMPHTTYGVLKAIRSHEISSPRVRDDLDSGRPNACNLCHLDKTLAWTSDHLNRWFAHETIPVSATAANIPHAVRLAVAGDAGQRALLAWHLGWSTALEISGTNWVSLVIGQLMEDPYAAVRLVAERSGKAIGDIVPLHYDYSLAPDRRLPVRERVWEKYWIKRQSHDRPNQEPGWTELESPAEVLAVFDALLGARDQRSVRLRE